MRRKITVFTTLLLSVMIISLSFNSVFAANHYVYIDEWYIDTGTLDSGYPSDLHPSDPDDVYIDDGGSWPSYLIIWYVYFESFETLDWLYIDFEVDNEMNDNINIWLVDQDDYIWWQGTYDGDDSPWMIPVNRNPDSIKGLRITKTAITHFQFDFEYIYAWWST